MDALILGKVRIILVCVFFQKDKEKAIAYHQCSFRLPLGSLVTVASAAATCQYTRVLVLQTSTFLLVMIVLTRQS